MFVNGQDDGWQATHSMLIPLAAADDGHSATAGISLPFSHSQPELATIYLLCQRLSAAEVVNFAFDMGRAA